MDEFVVIGKFSIMDEFAIIGGFLHVLWIYLEPSYVFL